MQDILLCEWESMTVVLYLQYSTCSRLAETNRANAAADGIERRRPCILSRFRIQVNTPNDLRCVRVRNKIQQPEGRKRRGIYVLKDKDRSMENLLIS
jgi:hypothetical protein